MRNRLSNYERETIINFNEAEDKAYIYTCSKVWMRHMEDVLGLKPTKVYSYAREYECPKSWIKKPRRPRQISENQKQKLRDRLARKQILSRKTPCAVDESKQKYGKQYIPSLLALTFTEKH